MSEKLKELLEKINEEGLKKAEEKAGVIEQKAMKDSEKIIEDARISAQKIIEQARRNAEKTTQTSLLALKQAYRDLMLSLREDIKRILNKIISAESAQGLSSEDMAKILGNLIETFVEKDGKSSDIKVLLKKEDLEKIRTGIMAKLKDTLKEGIEFKAASNINAGFSISFDQGKSFFDFTDEGLTEAISAYLNSELADLIK